MKDLELNDGLVGSTTAILAHLQDDEMTIANMGDCGIMVLRDYVSVYNH
jgi:serine/threonine protein phosphatase PrpC